MRPRGRIRAEFAYCKRNFAARTSACLPGMETVPSLSWNPLRTDGSHTAYSGHPSAASDETEYENARKVRNEVTRKRRRKRKRVRNKLREKREKAQTWRYRQAPGNRAGAQNLWRGGKRKTKKKSKNGPSRKGNSLSNARRAPANLVANPWPLEFRASPDPPLLRFSSAPAEVAKQAGSAHCLPAALRRPDAIGASRRRCRSTFRRLACLPALSFGRKDPIRAFADVVIIDIVFVCLRWGLERRRQLSRRESIERERSEERMRFDAFNFDSRLGISVQELFEKGRLR